MENEIDIRSILALNHHWYNILLDYLSSKLTIKFSTYLIEINKSSYEGHYKNNSYIEARVQARGRVRILTSSSRGVSVDWTPIKALMQKNLSSLKYLRLTMGSADQYDRKEDLNERIILIKKEGFQ